jgi:hypothetical protein
MAPASRRLDLGGRRLVAEFVDQADDPGGVIGGEIRPPGALGVERHVELMKLPRLGQRHLQQLPSLIDREPVVLGVAHHVGQRKSQDSKVAVAVSTLSNSRTLIRRFSRVQVLRTTRSRRRRTRGHLRGG